MISSKYKNEFQVVAASIKRTNQASIPSTIFYNENNKLPDAVLWHRRLGRVPLGTLQKISSLQHDVLCDSRVKECIVCPSAKQTRLSFPLSTSVAHSCFHTINEDVRGPYRVSTHDDKKYFLTLVDDHSRYTRLYLLPTKSDAIATIKNFFTMVHNVYSCTVKYFRTDNGCEFFNSQMTTLLQSLGIIYQCSCVYTPQQNDIAEKGHRYILKVLRSLRFQAKVSLKFWEECVTTAVYVINRLPFSVLQGKSPFEKLFGHALSFSHMRVFGCLSYVTCVKKTDKFAPRVIPAVFLGYSHTRKV